MARLLVHVTCGPENPTKGTLGFLVARAAVEEGHDSLTAGLGTGAATPLSQVGRAFTSPGRRAKLAA